MLESFQISPEDCLILRAFIQAPSLREAAKLLDCDASVLMRKVHRMSSIHGLMQKTQGRWTLTDRGTRAAVWVEQSIAAQKVAMSEKPRQRIATTMWLAEQVLIPNFRALDTETNGRFVWAFHTASPRFEIDLLNGTCDYVISCSVPSDPMIAHKKITPEIWIAIVPKAWATKLSKLSPAEQITFLKKKPYIRHLAISPEVALGFKPTASEEGLLLDSLISVRSAVLAGHGWSCVPEILVRSHLSDGSLMKANIPVHAQGELCVWWLRSRNDAKANVHSLLKWASSALKTRSA